jgi:hypothetical protein
MRIKMNRFSLKVRITSQLTFKKLKISKKEMNTSIILNVIFNNMGNISPRD